MDRVIQRQVIERAVCGNQALGEAGSFWFSGSRGVCRRSSMAYGSRFSAGFRDQAESLEIAEARGERLLDQPRGQGGRRPPAADPDQGADLRVGPSGQQDQQGAADLDEMEPAQQGRAAPLPHSSETVDEFQSLFADGACRPVLTGMLL
jgi:hypothetical protein